MDMVPRNELRTGDVGYIISGIKTSKEVKVGDTITHIARPCEKAIAGFEEVKPMVFAGVYPIEAEDFEDLRASLEKLQLNDASLTFQPESAKKELARVALTQQERKACSIRTPDAVRFFCLPGAKQPHIKKGGLHYAADKNTGCGLRTADVVFHGAGDGGCQRRAQARRDVKRGLPARAERDRVHGRDRLCLSLIHI